MMNTLTTDEIINIARKAKSLMHRDELAWLIELARQAPDGVGVEVGVYCGASLIAWSLAREGRGQSIGVDNWSYQDDWINQHIVKGNEHNSLQVPNLKAVCQKNLNQAHITAQLLDGASVDMAKQAPNDLAFVFIDGDHTSPAIDNDIAAWTPKIMQGGIIAFHDYGRRKNGCRVTQAVDSWQAVDRWGYIGKAETTVGFRKP